jgi:Exostosin family
MGDGWSARVDDAVVHGCIPVIVMDDVHVSFKSIIDISLFTLRITFDDIERIPEMLLAVPDMEIDEKQLAIAKVWRRYCGINSYNATVTKALANNRLRQVVKKRKIFDCRLQKEILTPH